MREETLGELIARQARGAPDGALALQTGAGLVIACAAVIWRGPGWMVVCAIALALTSFGAWGIIDRELGEREAGDARRHALPRLARTLAAMTGGVAALAVLFSIFALALGTWRS